MVAEIRVYFEGDRSLREGFRAFFDVLYVTTKRRCRIRLIDCGATGMDDFKAALRSHPRAWNALLIDSDGPDNGKLFAEFGRKAKLPKALENHVFWMVQVMESWFLADIQCLKRFYGQGLRESALRGSENVEQIPKVDVYKRLRRATKHTAKGEYHKTAHAPQLLRLIRPEYVRRAAPNCERMFQTILAFLARLRA